MEVGKGHRQHREDEEGGRTKGWRLTPRQMSPRLGSTVTVGLRSIMAYSAVVGVVVVFWVVEDATAFSIVCDPPLSTETALQSAICGGGMASASGEVG